MDESTSNDPKPSSEDSDMETEPFKKAKYAWQIKGRARWKNKKNRTKKPKTTRKDPSKNPEEAQKEVSNPNQESQTANSPSNSSEMANSVTQSQNGNELRNWQSKQVAKAIIDNAINKVLEDMGVIPLPADAFDFHLVDSDINALNIEDKGVSEAIKQQGLHRRRHLESGIESRTTCTYWLHWNTEENDEVKLPVQDNVLDAALNFAINEKGLGVMGFN